MHPYNVSFEVEEAWLRKEGCHTDQVHQSAGIGDHLVSTAHLLTKVPLTQSAPVSLLHNTAVEVTGGGVTGVRHEGATLGVAPVVPLVDKPLELGGMDRLSM